ncbi:hypothetical protein BQ8482_260005 [Mesorhizobium delmotii]|uniref:Uncharacterized protein n=1 Tax=Mesorhizobium delmotii TaxID=1631247 RepID=A0A2P9AM75_9HYPH|nr:hypothetical protein BQ8482_260005 [Mesorhizobium delmotii]
MGTGAVYLDPYLGALLERRPLAEQARNFLAGTVDLGKDFRTCGFLKVSVDRGHIGW